MVTSYSYPSQQKWSSLRNYRPISLTRVTCKIMERVVVSDKINSLRHHGIISKQQHGFLSGRSTTSNLLETFNDWTLALNDKNSVAVADIDFAKAFDTVTSRNLQSYGISGCLLSWICSFLNGRTQQTRVGNSLSTITSLSSGVVQGNVIGSLLFVLFINDITHIFITNNCAYKLNADDLKLYTVVQTDIDCAILQEKLNAIYEWSRQWQQCISYKKCNLMYIGNTPNRPSSTLNDISLAVVDEVRGLGVIVDSRLKFDAHIHQTVVRAFV